MIDQPLVDASATRKDDWPSRARCDDRFEHEVLSATVHDADDMDLFITTWICQKQSEETRPS